MTPHFCKTREELAYLLVSRGMVSSSGLSMDELQCEICHHLSQVNYHRLAAYWFQFRRPLNRAQTEKRAKTFLPGTCWERIVEYYRFDHQLRLLLFDAISRIEIALREQVASVLAARLPDSVNPQNSVAHYRSTFHTAKHGKNGKSHFTSMMEKVNAVYHGSDSIEARHYLRDKHITEARFLPVWAFMEFATFGNLNILFSVGLKSTIVAEIATQFGFSSREFFVSAVSLLHRVRNQCAHQGRVWNRHWLQFSPHGKAKPVLKTPDRRSWTYQISKQDEWQLAEDEPDCLLQSPVCTAAALTVCSVMLRAIAPRCDWRKRLFSLFSDCGIPAIHQEVGFAYADWQKHPLWSEEAAY